MNRLQAIAEWASDRLTTIFAWIGGAVFLIAGLRLAWLYPLWSAFGGVLFALAAGLVLLIRRRGPLSYQYATWRYARILDLTRTSIAQHEDELKRSMRGVLRDAQKGFYTWEAWVPVRDDYIVRQLMPLLTAEERAAMTAPNSMIRGIVNGMIDGDVLERCERDGPLELLH